jgi:G3E family GTPase
MNLTSKFTLPAVLDPVVAAVMEQLAEQVEVKDRAISAKDRVIAQKTQALSAAEAIIQQLKEALRMERIHKYGKQSEKLSDLQLELLDREPAVSSDEIESEAASGPLSEEQQEEQNASSAAEQQQKKRKPHQGRNELPAHLERIEEIVACAAEQCTCGKCGAETRVIGYEETEVLGMKPAVHFVRVIKREKRACALRHRGCDDSGSAGPHRA